MIDRLLHALARSKNEAADDVLLEALRVGDPQEQQAVLDALLRRQTVRGLGGVIGQYDELPESLQLSVLRNVKTFHHALRECGRSDQAALRLAAMRLIALGRQGKLAYVLSENLHSADEARSKAACEALVALARWVAMETRRLQSGGVMEWRSEGVEDRRAEAHSTTPPLHHSTTYQDLLDQRPEIEAAVARAMDVHRGKHGQDLLRAGLLLCDWPGSKTLAILKTTKHGGQSPMVRRLQQPPASEHVEAFLLGASHGQLRSHFGSAFAQINETPVLDALLRKTHWLKDNALDLCMRQVSRGVWWAEAELARDLDRRGPEDAARVGEWVAASGAGDAAQDQRLEAIRQHVMKSAWPAGGAEGQAAGASGAPSAGGSSESFAARLRLLRAAARRKRGASVGPLKGFLADPDDRLVRMAAREIVRRRPPDFANTLLRMMTTAPDSVRRVIGRAVGQSGFDHFWQNFDQLNKPTRKRAGQAMLKLLPDALHRLQRRLAGGPPEQRLKAMQIAHELGLGDAMREQLLQLCSDGNPRLRSKAVALAGQVASVGPELLVERLLNDPDPRVRANTIEVLEARKDRQFLPALAARARAANNRERANAIKALHALRVGTINEQLAAMLRDARPEHRISALWVLRQVGWWPLLAQVGQLAKADASMKVRRYALGVLRGVAELAAAQAQQRPAAKAG